MVCVCVDVLHVFGGVECVMCLLSVNLHGVFHAGGCWIMIVCVSA